jgi:glucoamylase
MMDENQNTAPGGPGIPPRWTSSAKTGIGSAMSSDSHVWFTLSHGIFNEIYYPRVDYASTRDMGMIVTDGKDFFSEEKRHTTSEIEYLGKGIPAYRLVNTCNQGRYRIEKEVICDPHRDVVLQRIYFKALQGTSQDYHLYLLLSPHLGNRGMGNSACTGDYKGVPMLFASRDEYNLALACSSGWLKRSAGYVGVSDGWQDLFQHHVMEWTYTEALDGNVALTGEIDLSADEPFTLALGFGTSEAEAGQRALASLYSDFDHLKQVYMSTWQGWQTNLRDISGLDPNQSQLYRTSLMVLLAHEAKHSAGGIIASLSIPWGMDKGDDNLGGYHLIWPRDLVEAVGGLLAAGAKADTRRVIDYLQVTQEADGHWPQNMWLDGKPYWGGVQLDETAFPILLIDLAWRKGALTKENLKRYWPMVCKAASYLVCNGPVTPEDRWEEDPGYSPFTLAVEIAGLLVAADIAEINGENKTADYLRDTADGWNDSIERWIYVKNTDLAHQVGVEGYYVRIAPPEVADAASPLEGFVPIKNRPPEQSEVPAAQIVSPDALALVRFGLRAANNPRVINTVKVIDALLRVELPGGPAWHRYNDDGYGEHEDGSSFDGTGIGRAWPLLTGERAHYELAAGNMAEAQRLRQAMLNFSNQGFLLPEQVWDAPDIPERELFLGKPSGSAMPLVWAHSEYIKLCRSIEEGSVYDMPPQPVQRYQVEKRTARFYTWRFSNKCHRIPAGVDLRVELLEPARMHWTVDGWKSAHDSQDWDSGLGMYVIDIPSSDLPSGSSLEFTFFWPSTGLWEGNNYQIKIGP